MLPGNIWAVTFSVTLSSCLQEGFKPFVKSQEAVFHMQQAQVAPAPGNEDCSGAGFGCLSTLHNDTGANNCICRRSLEMIVEAIYLQEDDLGKGAIKLFDVNNAQRWTKMRHSTFVPNLVSDMQLPSAVKQL